MSEFHSTVSRRDFMKGLGLAGAGLGAAAAVSPVFHDLDEMAAAGNPLNRPWYITEREYDNPTMEVDWNILERCVEGRARDYDRYFEGYDADERSRRSALKSETELKWRQEKKPGWKLQDYGISGAAASAGVTNTFAGGGSTSPESLGVPKWTGTPEEAASILRVAMRIFGAFTIGFTQLEERTTKKLIYSYDRGSDRKGSILNSFKDVDEGYEVTNPSGSVTERVFPNKARWVITMVDQESTELWKLNPTKIMTQVRYERGSHIQERTQRFIKALGYQTLSAGHNSTGIGPAFSVMCGQGEMSRTNRLITPEYGHTVGMFRYVTDLPVPNEKPIDAGIWKFCHTCKKCAESCAEGDGGPPMWDEPKWEIIGPWNTAGKKTFYDDRRKCSAYRGLPGACTSGKCMSVCTFTKHRIAGIHDVVQGIAATTSIFNGFFKVMDDVFYGDGLYDPEDFWKTTKPVYGIDSTIGM
jgi:reductive dehalogenase